MAKKIGKLDFKKKATDVLILGATGAVAQIVSEAVLQENPETMDYVLAGVGLVLPELVKDPMVHTAGDALVAISAYRMAERYDLGGKLGIKNTTVTPPATSGLGSTWKPRPAGQATVSGAGNSKTVL